MELRYQTQSFFVMLACLFFLAGCGSYQVEESEETETSGPYGVDVTLSNAQLFTSLYPLHLYFFDSQGAVSWEEPTGMACTFHAERGVCVFGYIWLIFRRLSSSDGFEFQAISNFF